MEPESAEEFALGHQLNSHRSAVLDFVFQRVKDSVAQFTSFGHLRPRLRLCLQCVKDSVGVVRYERPSNDQPASQNRANGHFHLACPYYLLRPGKYQACLLECSLQSIEAVIEHLQEHHVQPPYCPICSQTFVTATERDSHLRARTCLRRESSVDGISIEQKGELVEKDSVEMSFKNRWRRILGTVFETSGSPPSLDPYLSSGVGLAVSVTRDFWDENGHILINEYLENACVACTTEEADALSRCVLQDVLRKLIN